MSNRDRKSSPEEEVLLCEGYNLGYNQFDGARQNWTTRYFFTIVQEIRIT